MGSIKAPSAGQPPIRLFLSYARADQPAAERLALALEKAGFAVWWDGALEGGHHFAAEIERELNAADAVIVLWSEASVKSGWVLDEAMHGRDRGCLIPVRFDETVPPLGFRQIQAIDLDAGDSPREIESIGRAVARIRGLPVQEPGSHPRSEPGRQRRGKATGEQRPVWVPFAWALFGMVWALIFWGMARNG